MSTTEVAESTPTVANHLEGAIPTVRAIYLRILEVLNDIGTVEEDPKKTCIHLNRKSAMVGVYIRKSYVNLEFKTDYPIESARINKSEQVSRNRYHHSLRLESPSDLDEEAIRWLADAHRLSS